MIITGLNDVVAHLATGDTFFYFTVDERSSNMSDVCGPNTVTSVDPEGKVINYTDHSGSERDSSEWSGCVFTSNSKEEVEEMHGRYATDNSWRDDEDYD